MKADKHGTTAGYWAGCRDDCCRPAAAAYERQRLIRRYINRGPLISPRLGVERRIHALMALGWSTRDIDRELGQKRTYTSKLLENTGPVLQSTAQRVDEVYRRLCMTPPTPRDRWEQMTVTRLKKLAAANGWAAPLMWDDIDRDAEPATGEACDVDPVVVARILAGETIPTTRAEREEVVRRWVLDGRPVNELARQTGWRPERYYTQREAVA